MSIQSYQSETGETLWKAYISIRSKINPSIRVQRWKFGLKSEKQAEREEKLLERECYEEVLRKENQGATWGRLVEDWERHVEKTKSHEINAMTREDYASALRKHTQTWWNRAASEISRGDVEEVLSHMQAQGATVGYRNKMKSILNRVFTFGINFRLIRGIDRSPAYGINLGREEEKQPEILTIDQIKRLLQEAKSFNHPWYSVWAMALLTGMRSGELYALLWEDIDWTNRQISVRRSYNCRMRIVKCPKAKEWRTVPISDQLLALLEELKVTRGKRSEVLPRVDRWENGDQAAKLRAFCEGIGLPSIKFHTLRACFATQLIRNGVPPIQIQKVCGWKDLETMQRYIRLAGIEVEGVTDSLNVLPESQIVERAATLFSTECSRTKVNNRDVRNGAA